MSVAGALPRPGRRTAAAAVVDVALVITFTGVGRRTHEEGLDLLGWAHTAWPFVAGLGVGWAVVVLTRRRWPTGWVDGVVVWLGALVGGMALRAVSGQGTALPFVVVATVFLGTTLVGWRMALSLVDRRGREPGRTSDTTKGFDPPEGS